MSIYYVEQLQKRAQLGTDRQNDNKVSSTSWQESVILEEGLQLQLHVSPRVSYQSEH